MHASHPISVLALLLLPAGASAAMIGNPVARPSAGRVALGAAADAQEIVLRAHDCGGDACEAVWRPVQLGLRGELALARGLGLQGGGSWQRESISEAGYSGSGTMAWGGVEAALPVGGDLWLAAVAQLQWGLSRGLDSQGEVQASNALSAAQAAALAAWAPGDDSFALYGGAAFHPYRSQVTVLEAHELELGLAPAFPVAGVLGVELRSDPVGVPWASSSSRVVFGVEARVEKGLGGHLWLGAAF